MKLFILYFLAALAFVLSSTENVEHDEREVGGYIDKLINDTLNAMLAKLDDPLIINEVDVDLSNNSAISGGLNITKVTVTGIKEIVASAIDVTLTTMALNMTIDIPELTVAIKYWADMLLEELVPLYGQGLLNLDFTAIKLIITGKASIAPKLGIKNITVDFTLADSTFNFNGLINNPEFSALVSTALNDNFAEFCNTYHDVISYYISPVIEAIINNILGADTEDNWEDILNLNESPLKLKL